MTDQQVADKMIKVMVENGLTPDQMLEVIKLARVEYARLKALELKTKNSKL